jgi:hypothetical protein
MSAADHERPNETIDFESALTSTPDITLHRTKRREGPTTDILWMLLSNPHVMESG